MPPRYIGKRRIGDDSMKCIVLLAAIELITAFTTAGHSVAVQQDTRRSPTFLFDSRSRRYRNRGVRYQNTARFDRYHASLMRSLSSMLALSSLN